MMKGDLMFYASDKMPPDDFLIGYSGYNIDPICSWHWNSASILYVLTPLIVSIEAGEKTVIPTLAGNNRDSWCRRVFLPKRNKN